MHHIFFIDSSLMDSGHFQISAIGNNAAINKGGHISLLDTDFNAFGYIPRNEIAGSCQLSF